MRNVGIIMRRELASYFATPIAYVFILIFLTNRDRSASANIVHYIAHRRAGETVNTPRDPSKQQSQAFRGWSFAYSDNRSNELNAKPIGLVT